MTTIYDIEYALDVNDPRVKLLPQIEDYENIGAHEAYMFTDTMPVLTNLALLKPTISLQLLLTLMTILYRDMGQVIKGDDPVRVLLWH